MKEWFSRSEIAGLPGAPGRDRDVARWADTHGVETRPREGRGGGYEYRLSTFPEETRLALISQTPDYQAGKEYAEKLRLAEEMAERDRFLRMQRSLTELHSLNESERARMEARLEIIQLLGVFEENTDLSKRRIRDLFVELYGARDLELSGSTYKEVSSVSARSLRRWQRKFQEEGPTSLAGRYRSPSTCIIEDDPEIMNAAIGLIREKGPHVNAANVHELLEVRFDDDAPSLRTVQRFIKNWRDTHIQVASYLDSPETWRSKHMVAFGRLDDEVVRPNQVWEMDSTLSDIQLAERLPGGETRFVRFAVLSVVDVFTRRVLFLVCRTSRSIAIATLMRKAILAWGVPEIVRMDNGKDYSSKHIELFTQTLSITVHRCRPFQPQEKPFVERAFRTMQGGGLELLPGFVGHNVAERQRLRSREQSRIRAGEPPIDLGAIGMGPLEFQVWLDEWAENQYARKRHSGLGCSPFERIQNYAGRVLRISDERALDLLLEPVPGKGGQRTVQKNGIQVGRDADGRDVFYVAPELGAYEGEQVLCFLDPYDDKRICVYGGEDPHFICWAETDLTPEQRQRVATRAHKIQRLMLREEMKELDRAAKESGTDTSWAEIAVRRSQQAAALQLMPKASDKHETDMLSAASAAADARDRLDEEREIRRENTPEERADLARMRAAEKADPLQRPKYWGGYADRYDYLCRVVQAGREDELVTTADRAFAQAHQAKIGLPEESWILADEPGESRAINM